MNPIIKNLLINSSKGFIKDGLIEYYDFIQGADSQILYGKFGNYGTLGSTTGSDTNDPTWTSQGLSFVSDDYVKLPYLFTHQNDFTVMLAVNVPIDNPLANSVMFGIGSTTNGTPYLIFYQGTSGTINCYALNNASSGKSVSFTKITGDRVLYLRNKGGQLLVGDVIGNVKSAEGTIPADPFTLDIMAIGARPRLTSALSFITTSMYGGLIYNRCLSDNELLKNANFLKRVVAPRGISL